MSYLHCPTCKRAYNLAASPACPSCGAAAGTPEDPTDDIVSAAEQLARALARASDDQRDAAAARLDRRRDALPPGAPSSIDQSDGPRYEEPAVWRSVRSLVAPLPRPALIAPPALIAQAATAVLARIAPFIRTARRVRARLIAFAA